MKVSSLSVQTEWAPNCILLFSPLFMTCWLADCRVFECSLYFDWYWERNHSNHIFFLPFSAPWPCYPLNYVSVTTTRLLFIKALTHLSHASQDLSINNFVLVWIALKLRCVYECCVLFFLSFFFLFFFCFHAFLEECGYCSMNSSHKCWLFQ